MCLRSSSLLSLSFFLSIFLLQFVFFAGGRVLPKHNAEGPEYAAGEVQVDQADQGGRDVGPLVSEETSERGMGLPKEIYPMVVAPS